MAKKVVGEIKLQLPAGKATPAPPVGPALGQHGVNIMEFVKQFNAKTADQPGMVIPVVITVYADRSFTFIMKTPPASVLIRKTLGLEKGSNEPNKKKVGILTQKQVEDTGSRYVSGQDCLIVCNHRIACARLQDHHRRIVSVRAHIRFQVKPLHLGISHLGQRLPAA